MAETEEKKEDAPETADAERTADAEAVARRKQAIKELEEKFAADPNDELALRLNRERDTLRHILLAQKGNPKERAMAKAEYAAKAAMRRAIQPVEE